MEIGLWKASREAMEAELFRIDRVQRDRAYLHGLYEPLKKINCRVIQCTRRISSHEQSAFIACSC